MKKLIGEIKTRLELLQQRESAIKLELEKNVTEQGVLKSLLEVYENEYDPIAEERRVTRALLNAPQKTGTPTSEAIVLLLDETHPGYEFKMEDMTKSVQELGVDTNTSKIWTALSALAKKGVVKKLEGRGMYKKL